MSKDKVVVSEKDLKSLCKNVLLSLGQKEEFAEIVADAVVRADLRGVKTHGTFRFPYYVERMEKNGSNVNPDIKTEKDNPSTGVLDADDGMGQIGAYKGMEKAIEKAKNTGIGLVTVKNSCHFGIAGYYSMQALEEDMVGISWSNGHAIMAPYGGQNREICNNPLSVAIPSDEEKPIVLDMAMSRVAGGKVRLAVTEGKEIPEGWLLDKNGKPTSDPQALFEGGALLPLGHKGYGLAIIGEVLSGALPGAGLLSQIPVWFKKPEEPTNTGHMLLAIDISKFRDIDEFKSDVDHVINKLKSSETAENVEEILMPGELEFRTVEEQKEKGIDLPEEIIADLNTLAEKHDVDKIDL